MNKRIVSISLISWVVMVLTFRGTDKQHIAIRKTIWQQIYCWREGKVHTYNAIASPLLVLKSTSK